MVPPTKPVNDSVVCSHSAFGLLINSNLPIPGLPFVDKGKCDVTVHFGMLPSWVESSLGTGRLRSASPIVDEHNQPTRRVLELRNGEYFYYIYADGTEFLLDRSATEVWARWPADLTLEDTATYLLGPIFGFLMRLRGFICLHASAVVIDNSASLFVGPAGAGKSTLAAAFAQLGYPVVSDDIAVIVDHGDHFLVRQAYPRVRLWSDSVSAFYGTEDSLPLLTPNWDKRYLDLTSDDKFFDEQAKLGQIYLLAERSETPTFEEMSVSDKLLALVANSYATYVLDREMRRQEFELISRLLQAVPVRRITSPSDMSRLTELCKSVVNDSFNENEEHEFQPTV